MKTIKINTPIPANVIRLTISSSIRQQTVFQTTGPLEYNILSHIIHSFFDIRKPRISNRAVQGNSL